jgi:hypothetical protein
MRLKPAAAGRRRARALGAWRGWTKELKRFDLLMLSAGPPEGGFVPKPPFHREHQDYYVNSTLKQSLKTPS